MRTIDDADLVRRAVAGDAQSYGELFDRYQAAIFNYAYGIVGSRDDAGDIAQEAFVKVFEALPRMADRQLDFKRYVYRTAHNTAMDAIRSRKRLASDEPLAFAEEPSLYADPERAALLGEQQRKVRAAAAHLPEQQRAILEMRELQELSYQEIADILEMPRNTVGVYLARARLKLKSEFRMSYVDADRLAEECKELLPLLAGYIDDELKPEQTERVEAHLEECRFCALALEEMTESSKSYRALLPLLPPAGLKELVWRGVPGLADMAERADAAERAGEDTSTSETPGDGTAATGSGREEAASASTANDRQLLRSRGPWLLAAGVFAGVVLGFVIATGEPLSGVLQGQEEAEQPAVSTTRQEQDTPEPGAVDSNQPEEEESPARDPVSGGDSEEETGDAGTEATLDDTGQDQPTSDSSDSTQTLDPHLVTPITPDDLRYFLSPDPPLEDPDAQYQ